MHERLCLFHVSIIYIIYAVTICILIYINCWLLKLVTFLLRFIVVFIALIPNNKTPILQSILFWSDLMFQ